MRKLLRKLYAEAVQKTYFAEEPYLANSKLRKAFAYYQTKPSIYKCNAGDEFYIVKGSVRVCLNGMQVGGGVGVHGGPHARGPEPRRYPRQAREGGGTGGARVHERGAHRGLLRIPPPSTCIPFKHT